LLFSVNIHQTVEKACLQLIGDKENTHFHSAQRGLLRKLTLARSHLK